METGRHIHIRQRTHLSIKAETFTKILFGSKFQLVQTADGT